MNYFLNSSGGIPLGSPPQPPHNITLHSLHQALQGLGNLGENFVYEAEHYGNRFVLFKFRREDGSRIALRVQQQWPLPLHPDIIQNIVRREVYVLKKLEIIQFKHAPKCLAFDLSFNNPIQHPFLVLTWAEGQRLIWTKDHPTMDLRMRIMNQLFEMQLELIDHSLESRAETAQYFYSRLIHDKMMTAPRGPPGAGGRPTQEDYWSQLAHLDDILGSSHDDKNYAVAHNNIMPENIIVDDDYNVECIIGWSHGGMYPLGQAAVLPRILSPNIHIQDNTEAHLTAEKALHDKIQYRHPLNLYSLPLTPAKQAMSTWLNGDDADFRALYMLSMKHTDVHAWLARHNWRPPYCHIFHDAAPIVPLPETLDELEDPLPTEYELDDKGGVFKYESKHTAGPSKQEPEDKPGSYT